LRVQSHPAFVIRTQAYSESSLLAEIFAQGFGRFGLLAKGVRRLKSPSRGLIRPFQPLLLSWSGRGELPVLSGAEAVGPAIPLVREALLCGFYMNELILRLLHRNDPHPELFQAYESGLHSLAGKCSSEMSLRIFEKRLLKELGYALVLDREVENGAPVDPDRCYKYVPEQGPVPIHVSSDDELTVHGSTLLELAGDKLTAQRSLSESKRLLRVILSYHLNGRPLNSRRLVQRLRERTNPTGVAVVGSCNV